MVAGIGELPARLVSQGSAVRALTTQLSGALAVAVLGSVVAARMGSDPTPRRRRTPSTRRSCWPRSVCSALALASRLPGRPLTVIAREPAVTLD